MAGGGFYSIESLRGVYVLLVDEDVESRATLGAVLRYCGALVRDVAGATEAQVSLRETIPDVLVIGVRAPAALALLRGLRALWPEQGGKIPAVGVGPPSQAATARQEGFEGFLQEPIDPWVLCRVVSELTT